MFGVEKYGAYDDVKLKIDLSGNSGHTANVTSKSGMTTVSCCESNKNQSDPKGYTTHCGPNVSFILSECNHTRPVFSCMVQESPGVKTTVAATTPAPTPEPIPEPEPVDVIFSGSTDVFSLAGEKTVLNGEVPSGVKFYKWSFQRYGEPTFDTIGITYVNYTKVKSNCGVSPYFKKKTEMCSYEFVFNQTRKSDYGFYKRETFLTNGTLLVELFNLTVYHLKPVLSPVSYVGRSLRFRCRDTLNPRLSTFVKYIYTDGNMRFDENSGEMVNIKRKRRMVPLELQVQCCSRYGHQMQNVCSEASTLYLGPCANGNERECTEEDFNRDKEPHFVRKHPKEMCTRTIQSTTEKHLTACEGHWFALKGDFTGWHNQLPVRWYIKNPVNHTEEELIGRNGSCLSPRYGDCGKILIIKKVNSKDQRWYKVNSRSRSYTDMGFVSVSERIAVTLELLSMNNSQVSLRCSVNSDSKYEVKWDVRDGNLQPYSQYGNEMTKTIRYGCKSGLMHTSHLTVGCSAVNDAWMGYSDTFRIRRSDQDCSVVEVKKGTARFGKKIYGNGDGR